MLLLFVLVLKCHIEHLTEVLAKNVRGCTLNTSSRDWDIKFNRRCIDGTSEAFVVRFTSLDHRNGEQVCIDVGILVEDLVHEDRRLLMSGMSGVTFLPQEFPRPDEGRWVFEFPTHYISPLIQEQWQVSVRVNPLSKGRVHDRLRGGTDRNRLWQVRLAALGHPGDLR